LYVFDFGAPVGFRLATRHPERVDALIVQNGNAYEVGIGPNLAGLAPYWEDREAAEPAARGFLRLDATRAQYVEGVADPERLNPDLWTFDQHFLDLPGRDRVMLDLFYDYAGNLALYPAWQAYLREQQPATLITWGVNDQYFVADGARAYLADVPDAELHLLDTGHFALATHAAQIAELIAVFLTKHAAAERAAAVASR
jgi:pimeloyl-ACP methyl ester carboxylesterase